MDSKICIAIGCNTAVTTDKSQFCTYHWRLYRTKYNTYKSLTESVKRYIDNPSLIDKIDDSNKKLILISKFCYAGHLRREFQQLIKAEARDVGHNEMISKLLAIYNKLIQDASISEENSSEDDDIHTDLLSEHTVKPFRSKRYLKREKALLEQENERYMEMCDHSNQQTIDLISLNLQLIIDYFNRFLEDKIDAMSKSVVPILYLKSIIESVNSILSDKSVKYQLLVREHTVPVPTTDMLYFNMIISILLSSDSTLMPWNIFNEFIRTASYNHKEIFFAIFSLMVSETKKSSDPFILYIDSVYLRPTIESPSNMGKISGYTKSTMGITHGYEYKCRDSRFMTFVGRNK